MKNIGRDNENVKLNHPQLDSRKEKENGRL